MKKFSFSLSTLLKGIFSASMLLFLLSCNMFTLPYNGDEWQYRHIKSVAKAGQTIDLSFEGVFPFNWDKAYIVEDATIDREVLAEKLGVEDDAVASYERDVVDARIIFLYQDIVVCDFFYDRYYLQFEPKDIFFTNEDAAFKVSKKGSALVLTHNPSVPPKTTDLDLGNDNLLSFV
jgi:hypothetical protein